MCATGFITYASALVGKNAKEWRLQELVKLF